MGAGRLAVAAVPDEVFGRGDRSVLHRVLGRVLRGIRGQHIGGACGLQKRADALFADQHIHRQPGRGRSTGCRRVRAVHVDRQHHHR